MTLLDSMHNSEQNNRIPEPGSCLSAISEDEDISALLADIGDPYAMDYSNEEYEEEEEEEDVPESLDALVRNLPAELQPDPPPDQPQREEASDDTADNDEPEDAEDTTGSTETFRKYLLLAIIAIIIIVVIVMISKGVKSIKASSASTSDSEVTSTAATFFADQLSLTDGTTYQDSMTIEKYIELDQDSCLFVFKGYAENARAFVTAYVDINTYNQYKTGARVPILYEHITINGEDYYMKVRLNV